MRKPNYKGRLKMANSTDASILKKLVNDPHPEVRARVGRNPKTPEDRLRYLVRYECCLQVLKAVAKNPSIPEDIREELNEKIRRYSEDEVN